MSAPPARSTTSGVFVIGGSFGGYNCVTSIESLRALWICFGGAVHRPVGVRAGVHVILIWGGYGRWGAVVVVAPWRRGCRIFLRIAVLKTRAHGHTGHIGHTGSGGFIG